MGTSSVWLHKMDRTNAFPQILNKNRLKKKTKKTKTSECTQVPPNELKWLLPTSQTVLNFNSLLKTWRTSGIMCHLKQISNSFKKKRDHSFELATLLKSQSTAIIIHLSRLQSSIQKVQFVFRQKNVLAFLHNQNVIHSSQFYKGAISNWLLFKWRCWHTILSLCETQDAKQFFHNSFSALKCINLIFSPCLTIDSRLSRMSLQFSCTNRE